jgi:hypothetical protein
VNENMQELKAKANAQYDRITSDIVQLLKDNVKEGVDINTLAGQIACVVAMNIMVDMMTGR